MQQRTTKQHRILIRSLELRGNYGGILQAYALQRHLESLGHSVISDVSSPQPWKTWVRRSLRRRLFSSGPLRRDGLISLRVDDAINSRLMTLVREQIHTTRVFKNGMAASNSVVDWATAFLVGSDQVWRPAYSDLPSALFGFVPETNPAPVFSYAASFGRADSLEFPPALISQTRPLASRFDALSVREDSGVELVRSLWGRTDAEQHVDPTLLLTLDEYDQLITLDRRDDEPAISGGLVSYVLDASREKKAIADRLSEQLQVSNHDLLVPGPTSDADFKSRPAHFTKRSVSHWLGSFRAADFILTDSFHGCVFAILFHIPFLVLPNKSRGTARFTSLLRTFNLEDRSVRIEELQSAADLSQIMRQPIDWGKVQEIVATERRRSARYFERVLS